MPSVRLIRHEAVKDCGSFEVRVDGRRSRYFYWDDVAGRRLRPEQMTPRAGARTGHVAGARARPHGGAMMAGHLRIICWRGK
jgi:hypothetical protein